ncbi:MAG: murein tripeptide amidase MpaA [Myxococcota bacterium]
MHISGAFDGGNIEVLDTSDPTSVQLAIRADVDGKSRQWFCFRLAGARGIPCTLRLINAGQASYPSGWSGFRAVCSADGERWERVETTYEGGELHICHTPSADVVWFASFAPYSMDRHAALLVRSQAKGARIRCLGSTLDGQGIDLIEIGQGPVPIWVVARQHPGETMSAFCAEGLVDRLLDEDDAVSAALRERATIRVVPTMNPDGARRGQLRTNAAGVDLNRSWLDPDPATCPEVAAVRAEMLRTGAAIGLDLHGDEAMPYCFASRNVLGIPGLTAGAEARFWAFLAALERHCDDFQVEIGYPRPPAGRSTLRMCSTWMAHALGSLAVTIELPFKDNLLRPDTMLGWSPGRSQQLGAQAAAALLEALGGLDES